MSNSRTNARLKLGIALAGMAALVLSLAACGSDGDSGGSSASSEAAAGHIHGLGVDPGDGALFVATHGGLFRSADSGEDAEQVGDSTQDTMGFSITGAERFLGSGHPGAGESGPPSLGLIRSTDAGKSWEPVSLAGEADFHVLRSQGDRVYGFNGLDGQLMISNDGGETWKSRQPPFAIIDLAIDPDDPDRLLASTDRGIALSENSGDSWQPVSTQIGLLAWPTEDRVYLIDAGGTVLAGDASGEFQKIGSIGAQPVAFVAANEKELYAALADGSVLESRDGGSSWQPRTTIR